MLNLVLKDFLVQERSLKDIIISILLTFLLIFIFQFLGATCTYIVTPVLFIISFIIYSCGFGEKNDIDIMINSLPVSRKDIVFSKYLSIFVFFVIGIAITIIFSTMLKLSGLSHINRFINLQDIIISYIFTVVYSSIYLPIYLWLGYLKSQSINRILNFCIFICLICIVVVATVIDNGTARKSIMDFVFNFKLFMFISCICFSIILIFISIVTSLKLYLNRDL